MKAAVLIIYEGKKIKRVMWFASHLQALDVANEFKSAGHGWSIHLCESYEVGEVVEDMPEKQLTLFD